MERSQYSVLCDNRVLQYCQFIAPEMVICPWLSVFTLTPVHSSDKTPAYSPGGAEPPSEQIMEECERSSPNTREVFLPLLCHCFTAGKLHSHCWGQRSAGEGISSIQTKSAARKRSPSGEKKKQKNNIFIHRPVTVAPVLLWCHFLSRYFKYLTEILS